MSKKGVSLDVVFSVKTHKAENPCRVIVTKRGSWLPVLAKYLQRQPKTLRLSDLFLVEDSGEVANYLKDNYLRSCRACSFDAVGLCYSISHDMLLKAVKN